MSAEPAARGGDAVRHALIEAACDGLAEVGPRALSTRSLAERAGVNHGQIHHYFGGKRPLLKAAMAALATEHWHNSLEWAGGAPIPPALSLAEDTRYWQATARAVIEGDLDLARVEIDRGLSVPRRALDALREQNGAEDPDLEVEFALMVAAQLGWVAFEAFAMLVVDVAEADRGAFRERLRLRLEEWVDAGVRGRIPEAGER